jgi:glycosyltransferase involved in cell wall biosynthesis
VGKYVFINQDSGYLMIDIVNAYAEAGHQCVLMTGRLVVRNREVNSSVKVERIKWYNRSTNLTRLWSWIIGSLQILLKIVFKYRKWDLFIVSNPPTAVLLPLLLKNPFSLLIFDIYPDVLSELGYFKPGSLVIRLWKKFNERVYRKATRLFTITEGMGEVLRQYAGNNPVNIIHLWTDNSFLKPLKPVDNHFITRHMLQDKFVVLYSGNIGLASEVDILIDVASKVTSTNIFFLIIGEGAKKESMAKKVRELDLSNVKMLPFQPAAELPYSFSSAQLAVVALGRGETKLAVPSKLYNYLSVGAPLLCISSPGSEVHRLVENYHCGKNFDPDDLQGIMGFIIYLAENPDVHNRLKENSLIASRDFSGSNVRKFLPLELH